jgi:hypothetical protein
MDGTGDGPATAIAAVKPCAFGAPRCGFLALLQVGRVQPQIRPLAEQRTVKERMNPLVDVLA